MIGIAVPARLVMFTILGLLVLATSASAEDAWVLWVRESQLSAKEMKSKKEPSITWRRVFATSTEDACRRALKESVDSATKYYGDEVVSKSATSIVANHHFSGRRIRYSASYQCFPDTIDPRLPQQYSRQ